MFRYFLTKISLSVISIVSKYDTLLGIKDKISKREMFYDHFADKSATNKWESDYKLQNIDLDLLPKYLIDNKNKYKDWFDLKE